MNNSLNIGKPAYMKMESPGELQVAIDETKQPKVNGKESILLVIATMIAKHMKSEKKTELTPKQLEEKYIEAAITKAVKDAVDNAINSGSLLTAFKSVEQMLDLIKQGNNGPGLTQFINNTVNEIKAFKMSPTLKKEIAEVKKMREKYEYDRAKYEEYKRKFEKGGGLVPGYAEFLEAKMVQYGTRMNEDLGESAVEAAANAVIGKVPSQGKADVYFDSRIRYYENQIKLKLVSFLKIVSNTAERKLIKIKKDLQLDLSQVRGQMEELKQDAYAMKALGQLAGAKS